MGKYVISKIEYYIISQTSGLVNSFGEFFCNCKNLRTNYKSKFKAVECFLLNKKHHQDAFHLGGAKSLEFRNCAED